MTVSKEERARDAALAMRDYQAEKLAVLAKTKRLRELRLLKEAEAKPAAPAKKKATKKNG